MKLKILLGCAALCFALAAQAAPTILVLGDSLSAGYGLNAGEGWVSLLQQKLKSQGLPQTVVNASLSGDTTAGGLSRLPPALRAHKPDLVLIELGANDGLRGQSVVQMQANLAQLITMSRAAGARPLLLEMRIPSNYGAAYTQGFTRAFATVAAQGQAVLVPFFLAPIAGDEHNFQDDGIHPNAGAQARMLEAVWPSLRPLLSRPVSGSSPRNKNERRS